MARLGRSQPIQPSAWHGFVPTGLWALPPVTVVPLDADRHHLRPAQPAVAATHGFVDSGVGVPGTAPPAAVSLDRADQRARYLPLAPTAIVGIPADQFVTAAPPEPFVVPITERRAAVPPPTATSAAGTVDSGVGTPGTAPPEPFSLDRADQRVRYRPLDPIVLSGVLAFPPPPVDTPPEAVNVDRVDQRTRRLTPDPIVISGALASVPTPPADTPPSPLNIDRAPERIRRQTPDPTVLSGVLALPPVPSAPPPGPFVVPLEERRRFLAALPPEVSVGFDDPQPPAPYVVAALERGRLIVVPSVGQHGLVLPGPGPVGTTPPPAANLDRADQRVRYLPLPSLVLSGVLIPPPPPAVVTGQDDITPVLLTEW